MNSFRRSASSRSIARGSPRLRCTRSTGPACLARCIRWTRRLPGRRRRSDIPHPRPHFSRREGWYRRRSLPAQCTTPNRIFHLLQADAFFCLDDAERRADAIFLALYFHLAGLLDEANPVSRLDTELFPQFGGNGDGWFLDTRITNFWDTANLAWLSNSEGSGTMVVDVDLTNFGFVRLSPLVE